MERSSVSALKMIQELSALAERLAESDIVVPSLHCNWGRMGYWDIHAQQGAATEKYSEGLRGPNPMLAVGPYVLRCTWDSRDRLLLIAGSPTSPLCAPNQWRQELSKMVDSHYEAMGHAEKFIVERFGKQSAS